MKFNYIANNMAYICKKISCLVYATTKVYPWEIIETSQYSPFICTHLMQCHKFSFNFSYYFFNQKSFNILKKKKEQQGGCWERKKARKIVIYFQSYQVLQATNNLMFLWYCVFYKRIEKVCSLLTSSLIVIS